MARFGERLRALLDERHLTQREFCAKSGIASDTLARALKSPTPKMNQTTYRAIASGLGMSPTELDHQWRSTRVPQQIGDPDGIPVLSEVPAGNGDFDPTAMGADNGIGMGYIPRKFVEMFTQDPLAYGLKVVGDSMEPNYCEGDIVICSPHAVHEPGMPAAIRFGSELENECTLKRVFKTKDKMLELRGDNNDHLPRIVDPEHVVRMDRVVAKISRAM